MQSHATHAAVFITAIVLSMIVFAQCLELTYVIDEESPAMTRIGNLLEDNNIRSLVPNTELTDLRFTFLTEGNPQSSFLWINSTNGELRTSSRINREAICPKLGVCELKVKAVVQSLLGAFFKIIHVKLIVKDINDNAPSFDPSTLTIKVAESEAPGAFFSIPAASDLDAGEDNSAVEYTLLTSTAPFTLVLDEMGSTPHGVRIRLDTPLDRETVESYQLLVRAVDKGHPKLSGTLTVKIQILDINDNAPIFQEQQYNVSISDDAAVGSSVLLVKAVDLDCGDNGLVSYSLPSSQEEVRVLDMFHINRSTGQIKVKALLDVYAGRSYRVAVQASDSGNPHKTAETAVVISVLDTINSRPEILLNVLGTAGVAQVSELAEVGRAVAHVAVSDPDSAHSSNGHTSCYLDNTEQFQLQTMDVQQFKVILTKRLDREQQSHHRVTVICEDAGSPPLNASSSFVVEVGDENDNAPVFSSSSYAVEVTEGKLINDRDQSNIILTVQAADMDSGANSHIIYRLAENTDSDFGIYTDGSIVVTNPAGLDREDRSKGGVRNLVVTAVDSGRVPLTGTTRVVVTIKDVNDNPPRFSEPVYFFTVREDSPRGHTVGNISATDADLESSGVVHFKIHQGHANAVPFQISQEGEIKLRTGLDRETKSSYEFLVVAYDMGKPFSLSSSAVVKIKIADVNDNAPTFLFPSHNNDTIYIPRTLGKGTIFANLQATDLDEGANSGLLYSLESVNGSQHFDVQPSSGQIFVVQPLTQNDIGVHILTVTARNLASDLQMATSTLYVTVYEGNSTVSHKPTGLSVRNMVVVVVLVVVTVVLGVTILLTILLLRFVDKDKQRKFYSTKAEEGKVESQLKNINLYFSGQEDPYTSASDVTARSKDGGRKRKEVSFSLDEGSNAGSTHRMTNSSLSDICDFSSDNVQGTIKVRGVGPYHDEEGSDTSGEISTGDSGKGGSDVELQSNLGQATNSGNVTLQSQHFQDHRTNVNFGSNGQSNIGCRHPRTTMPPPRFQNGRPVVGSCIFRSTPSSIRPSLSFSHPQFPTHKNNINEASRYNHTPGDNGFYKNVNHDQCNN